MIKGNLLFACMGAQARNFNPLMRFVIEGRKIIGEAEPADETTVESLEEFDATIERLRNSGMVDICVWDAGTGHGFDSYETAREIMRLNFTPEEQ